MPKLLRSFAFLLVLANAGCGDDETRPNPDPDPEPDPQPSEITPAPAGIRRLTAGQYVGSVRVLFGDAAADAALPPDDAASLGLKAIGASEYSLAPADVETYELSARRIADAVLADPAAYAKVVPCTPSGPADSACFTQVAQGLGRLAWRRTLDPAEVTTLVGAATTASSSYGSFEAGVGAIVSATLQAPDFLYQIELGEPDPDGPEGNPRRRLKQTELASRLSFFLLGQTPDKALLDRAEANGLADDAAIRQAAAELIQRPEAKEVLSAFYAEVFEFDDTASLQKDPAKFPLFTDATRAAVAEETRLFLEDIVWTRNADAREIFDGQFTYVNEDNAWLYGLNVSGAAFQRIEVANRRGILTQPSFLAKHAHPVYTSPTRRGMFIITTLLCGAVPPPPPDVVPTLPPDDGTPKTMRQRLEQHATNESCSACHGRTDPPGLSMEHFDSVGAFRETDQGLTIDTAGSTPEIGTFASVADIGPLLRENPKATTCMARFLFRQSTGHLETAGEAPALEAIDEAFAAGGYKVQQLMVEIAASPAFRLVGEPK